MIVFSALYLQCGSLVNLLLDITRSTTAAVNSLSPTCFLDLPDSALRSTPIRTLFNVT
jgi:hypothetical protein